MFIIYCLFCLRDRVDNAPFEGNQEQLYEEENQQFGKEGKWNTPCIFYFDPNNSMITHFTLLLKLHKLDGNTY